MSLDLFREGMDNRLSNFRPLPKPEPGMFDNFLGAGTVAMQGFAEAGRAIDLAGSVGPIVHDAITGGTERQDRYFKEHDEVFGGAVKHWTPKPDEVGVAGQVVGKLLSTLPLVLTSPALAVGTAGLTAAEDLAAKGVSPAKATAVGMVQGAGLGLGIWMPILGANGWQRIALGGAGFNVLQGVATRGASGVILTDTPAAEDFKAFDPEAMTLDVLLGAAFGAFAHLSPAQRAQGAAAWERIGKWGKDLNPSEVDAAATLRQAQHINVDSVGGKPADLPDIEAHVNRMRTALDQFGRDQPIHVEDMPAPKVEADGRFAQAGTRAEQLAKMAENARVAEGLPPPDNIPDLPTAKVVEKAASDASAQAQRPEGQEGAGKAADPLAQAAERFVVDNAELQVRVGQSADGEPVTMTAKQYLEQSRAEAAKMREDAPLFQVAARCLFGAGA